MRKLICFILLFLGTCLFSTPISHAIDVSKPIQEEKTVVLKVHVLKDGSVSDISIRDSSGDEIVDNKAIEAVKKWRFSPVKDSNGEPKEVFTIVKIIFRPND